MPIACTDSLIFYPTIIDCVCLTFSSDLLKVYQLHYFFQRFKFCWIKFINCTLSASLISALIFSIHFFLIYLRGRAANPLATPLFPQWQEPEKIKTRTQKVIPGIPYRWQRSHYLSHHHCLPGSSLVGSWSQEPEHSNMGHPILNGIVNIRLNAKHSIPLPFSLGFIFFLKTESQNINLLILISAY